MFPRVLAIVFLTASLSFSQQFLFPDFSACFKKNQYSFYPIANGYAIAVSRNSAIVVTEDRLKNYIKFDPFLNLYQIRTKKNLKPVKLKNSSKMKLAEFVAAVKKGEIYIGNFAKRGDFGFDLLSTKTPKNSIITCLCCEMYGIGIDDGKFINSKYIKNFLKTNLVFYGDIGARFDQIGSAVTVKYIDPFYNDQKLKLGDKILKINKIPINSASSLNERILFAKEKKKIALTIVRSGKIKNIKLYIAKRYGGGFLSDTFLERYGFFFDKDLRIKEIKKDSLAQKRGVKQKDRLLSVDSKRVKSFDDVKEVLSNSKTDNHLLLFERNGFEFFVRVF